MIFSSPIFLFLFLPLTLALYFILPRQLRNPFLLLVSSIFYFWGEGIFALTVVFSIAANYLIARWIDVSHQKKAVLAFGVAVNLGLLGWFKYANFALENLNLALAHFGVTAIGMETVRLPLGISFFTFHAISYLIDIKRGNAAVQKHLGDFALYILLFPQLIAGPIIRYKDIAAQLANRTTSSEDFAIGFHRFVIGLGKKVLIANPLGEAADKIFAIAVSDLTSPVAWVGVIAYALQIYFDFSGYSDMAIGLMRMFGFRILENFNYPYVSLSVREFWRRWHISLSTWFRDYVYIPLGGNRRGVLRGYLNLVIIFVLCGFWHGASWAFLVWGLWHGMFLVLERTPFGTWFERMPRPLRHVYLLLVILVGWVFFRADTLTHAVGYLHAMAGMSQGNPDMYSLQAYLDRLTAAAIILGAIGSTPIWRWLGSRSLPVLQTSIAANALWSSVQAALMILVLLQSISFIAAGTYNPFIYFRF
jgi:alginate O-acetyltransferase complex protein AlgI